MLIENQMDKKPHPFSKEGRALREATKEVKEPKKETLKEIVQPNTPDLSKILEELQKTNERMARLEDENKKLKDGVNIHKDEKKIYDGHLSFKFKLWGTLPVCSYKSKYKDPSKDLLYKDGKGNFISNHLVVLTLSDGSTVEVDVNDFGRDAKFSEQYFAKDHNGEDVMKDTLKRVKHFVFETPEYGTFICQPKAIN